MKNLPLLTALRALHANITVITLELKHLYCIFHANCQDMKVQKTHTGNTFSSGKLIVLPCLGAAEDFSIL